MTPERPTRYFDFGDFAIPRMPKVGITSMTRSAKGVPLVGAEDILDKRVIAFIRDPFERLVSLAKFGRRRAEENGGQPRMLVPREYAYDWGLCVDHILNGPNEHWMPQTDLLTHKGYFVPTECYPFEKVNELWFEFTGLKLPHLNASPEIKRYSYREDDLIEYYKADIKLRWRLQ